MLGNIPLFAVPVRSKRAGKEIAALGKFSSVHIITAPKVWRAVAKHVPSDLVAKKSAIHLMSDAETHKDMRNVETLCRSLVRGGADRKSLVIAIGGGVTGDVAGFAAASYLRGVALVHVPTTLVSQVDSSIGGKTGVNLPDGKNLVGAFYPPRLILTDPAVLRKFARSRISRRAGGSDQARDHCGREDVWIHRAQHRKDFEARRGGAGIFDSAQCGDQGVGRQQRRKRIGTARDFEFWAYVRARAGEHDEISALSTWRSCRVGHDGGGAAGARDESLRRGVRFANRGAGAADRALPCLAEHSAGQIDRRDAIG